MYYVYLEGIILSSEKPVLSFTKSDEFSRTYSVNERVYKYTYGPEDTWSKVQDAELLADDRLIDFEGDLDLCPSHTINGLTFYLRHKSEKSGRLFSLFLDAKAPEITYEENSVGCWVVVPESEVSKVLSGPEETLTDRVKEFTSNLVTLINERSTIIYVSGEKFELSNIQAVDLMEEKVQEKWDSLKPYSDYPELYLVEADIIAAFIRECKKQFPEIDFFPQSSERKNLGKETIFYRSALSQNKSPKFSSNLIEREFDGRFFQTTIPVELHYQTADIKQYIHRRDSYLICRFLMDVHHFEIKKNRWWVDRFGQSEETFYYSTFWERDFVQNDLAKADANDGSGRDTYTLTMQCDLIGFIIERSESITPVQQVISSIYFG